MKASIRKLFIKLQGQVAIGLDFVEDSGGDVDDGTQFNETEALFYIIHPAFGDKYFQLDLYGGVAGGNLNELGTHELNCLIKGLQRPETNLVELLESWDDEPFDKNKRTRGLAKSGQALISILKDNNNFPELLIASQEKRLRDETKNLTNEQQTHYELNDYRRRL